MEKIEKKLREEQQRLLLSLETRLIPELITPGNDLNQLFVPSTKLNFIDQHDNDDDFYILRLTNDEKNKAESLNGINIRTFNSNNTLIDFISDKLTSNVFLIIDYELVSNILSFLDDFSQIIFIYVLANEESNNTAVITDSKRSIRQISNDKEELFRLIIEDVDTCTKDSICSTIFDLTATEESTNQTKNTSFIWYHLLIESLFDITVYNNKAKSDFIEYCRQQYPTNKSQQDAITEFENDYSSDDAIRWYTRNSFICPQLNKALRTRDIDAVFKFRFFIVDFQKQLEQHYNDEMIESLHTVYRGQQVSEIELIKLKNSLGKYISVNAYLSASIEKEVALIFAGKTPLSVLFEIEVHCARNLKNKRSRPVYVKDKSEFPQEEEVIFPIGSTFHVASIQMEDERWHIKLKLTDDIDYNQMIDLIQTAHMKNVSPKGKFASLLLSLGDYEKAERYIEMLIEDLELSSNNENIGYAYDLLGQVWFERSDYQCALSYFEKALNNIHLENVYRATIYRHIGELYCYKTEYNIALRHLNEGLEYKEKMDPLELADLYEVFGNVYREMKDFDNALFHVNQALNIRQSNLSDSRALESINISLGLIYAAKSDYTEALQLFKRALNIYLELFPNHPNVIFLYAYIGQLHWQCQNWSLAMIYSQKALSLIKTDEQKQNLNPLLYIFTFNMLMVLYNFNDDVANVFYYAQKAFNIYNQNKNIILDTYPITRTVHSNFGIAYQNLCDFTSALDFYFKALNLCKDMDDRISILYNIGKVSLEKGDTKMALDYFNDLLELNSQKKQPIMNDDTLFLVNFYMSDVYKLENSLEKSIFYAKEALQLELEQTHKNYRHIVLCYTKMMGLCPEKKKEYIEEILEIVQKHDISVDCKMLSHSIIALYYNEQKDYASALDHFKLSLEYESKCIPPCYANLINIYSNIGSIYKSMEGKDSDRALFYYEKSRDIYLELLNMKEIPTKDKKTMILSEGYILESISQSSSLTLAIFSVYYSIARYYVKKGDYEQALNHLKTINKIFNEYKGKKEVMTQYEIYSQIGFVYFLMQHYDEAIFFYEKSLAYISNDYNKYGFTFYFIAQVYYEKKEYLMVISKCKISLTFLYNSQSINHKQLALSHVYLILSYQEMNNYQYAIIFLKQEIEHSLLCNPIYHRIVTTAYMQFANLIHHLRPWDVTESLNYHLTALTLSEHHLYDSHLKVLCFSLGSFYLLNRKYDTALFYYNKTLEYYSKESDDFILIYQRHWLIYMHIGQLGKAYDTVKKIINEQFSSVTVDFIDISNSYIDMGFTYHQQGRYKLALKSYRLAFHTLEIYQNDRSHQNYSRIYNYIGSVYLEYGQITDARDYCLKFRNNHSLDKKYLGSTATSNIILGLVECKLGNYNVALDYLGQVWEYIFNGNLHYHLSYKILYNHIGYVYFKLGQTEIAMKNYLESLSLYSDYPKHPDLAQVYKNIGLIYEHEKDYPTALSYYKRALELVPNKKHPHCILYKSMIITLELKNK